MRLTTGWRLSGENEVGRARCERVSVVPAAWIRRIEFRKWKGISETEQPEQSGS